MNRFFIPAVLLTIGFSSFFSFSYLNIREVAAQGQNAPKYETSQYQDQQFNPPQPANSFNAPQLPQSGGRGGFGGRGDEHEPTPEQIQQQNDENRKIKIMQLVNDYRASDDDKKREKMVDELTKLSTEQFESIQKQREAELKQLEEQVTKLRALHDRREKEKKDIIGDRVRGLLRDADGLGWGDNNVNNSNFYPMQPSNTPINAPGRVRAR